MVEQENFGTGRRLINAIALEQAMILRDPISSSLLGEFADHQGPISSQELGEILETKDEWIAFSRLQRARVLEDLGDEFMLNDMGRELVEIALSDA